MHKALRRNPPAKANGHRYRQTTMIAYMVRFDDAQAAAIRSMADRDNISFAQAVRELCEWGLEASEEPTNG